MENEKLLIPNSTQIPNLILDFLIPQLPESETRCLLYICRRTYGFQKRRDAIGFGQFVNGIKNKEGNQLDAGTGLSRRAVIFSLKVLTESGVVTKQRNRKGVNTYELNLNIDPVAITAKIMELRKKYRLEWERGSPQQRLFPTKKGSAPTSTGAPACTTPVPRSAPTKPRETKLTKPSDASGKPAAPRTKSDHKRLMEAFHDLCLKTRGMKPVITGKDGANLKRILGLGIAADQLEKLILYFLADYGFRQFAPSISTFASAGILNGLMNRMQNRPEFWKELDGYAIRYMRPATPESERAELMAKLEAIRKSMGMPFTNRERSAIQEEAAAGERRAK